MKSGCRSLFHLLTTLWPKTKKQQHPSLPHTHASGRPRIKERTCRLPFRFIGFLLLIGVLIGVAISQILRIDRAKAENARILSTPMRQDSSLAAVSFLWKNQPTGQNRVYFQDEADYIKEAIWSEDSWSPQINIIGKAKPGTPLAATTRRVDFDHMLIWLFYLDEDDKIQWFEGVFVTCVPDIRNAVATKGSFPAHPSTKLAAIRRPCCDFDLWWLFYHDKNGNLCMLSSAEDNTQKVYMQDPKILHANSSADTSLAAIPVTHADYEEQVRLFYQRPDGTIAANDWKSPDAWAALESNASVVDGWQQEAEIRPAQLNQTSLAAFSSGYDMTSGLPAVVDVFSSSEQGIGIDTWFGANNNGQGGWVESSQSSKQASAFSFISKSAAVAVHQGRRAYVVNGHDLLEFQLDDDNLTWTKVGVVPTIGSPTAQEL